MAQAALNEGTLSGPDYNKLTFVYEEILPTAYYNEVRSFALNNPGQREEIEQMLTDYVSGGFLTKTQADEIRNEFNIVDTGSEEKGIRELEGFGVNINDTASVINPEIDSALNVYNIIDVTEGTAQRNYINRVLAVSKDWDNSMNGTFVNFNYGLNAVNSKGDIFVFYNGKWYQTNYKSEGKVYRDTGKVVYAEGGDSLSIPNRFYDKFGK